MPDIYSFMQGFGEAQDRVSRLKSESVSRQAVAADTAAKLFALEQDQMLAPYKLRGDIAASLDVERMLNVNREQDPLRMREFNAKMEDSIASYKNNAELRPKMFELARARIGSDLLNLGAASQETERMMANTTEERNAVLSRQGKSWRIVNDGSGTFSVVSADGKPMFSGLSEAQVTVWYNNAAKHGAAQFQTESTDFLDANAAARAAKQVSAGVLPPATGFEPQPQQSATPAQRQVVIPPELARAGVAGVAKQAEAANQAGIDAAQAKARDAVMNAQAAGRMDEFGNPTRVASHAPYLVQWWMGGR